MLERARRAPGTPRPRAPGVPWLPGPLRRRDLQPPYLCGDPRSTGSVDWLSGTFPGGGVAAPNRSRGQVGTPAATRGRTTLAPATGRRMLARPGKVVQRSAQAVHLLTVVVVGVCVRVPSLIWVRGPTRVRRQDDRWGIPGVRGRAVFWGRPRTSRGGRGLAGAGRGTSVCLWAGHALAISVRPPGPRAGPRPGRARCRRGSPGCGAPAGPACGRPPGWPGCRPGGP
jgi:hypothetical protein